MVKSFRLPEELFRELEDEAALQEITLNALVCSVLTKYVKHDRYMARLQYMYVPKKIVGMLLEVMHEDFMRELAYSFGRETLRKEVDLWPAQPQFDDLLNFFAMRMKYAGFGNVYLYRREDHYTLVLRHTFGAKFSKAWGYILKGFLDSFYEDADPKYVFADDQLTVSLKKPVVPVEAPKHLDLKESPASAEPYDSGRNNKNPKGFRPNK